MPKHDLIVIGAGPGGYIAAIRAAQLGLDVACVDENEALGGTCLRIGCIPSKALLESSEKFAEVSHLAEHGVTVSGVELDLGTMMKRKDKTVTMLTRGVASLFKKNGVTVYLGRGRLAGPGKVSVSQGKGKSKKVQEHEASHIILAPGTRPASLPGVEFDGDRIGSSTEALAYSKVPKHLVVIGAGVIGLELGSVWARLGSRVTVLEYLDRILPGIDSQIASAAQKVFEGQGLEFRLGSRVTAAKLKGKTQCLVECEGQEAITCDRVLLAVGRSPCSDDLGLDTVSGDSGSVELDKRGFIQVDHDYRTGVAGVYALGDVIGGLQLAHKSEEEGVACVEKIVNGYGHVNYDAIPGVVYTHPEIAAVGKTEDELKEQGIPYRKGVFPYRANGRARALGALDGQVKMLVHDETDRILGVHILGASAGDLIAEAVAAIEFGATAEDLWRTSHAHPTLAECLKEAALATAGRTLNL